MKACFDQAVAAIASLASCAPQAPSVDERGLGISALDSRWPRHQAFDRIGDVVRLVDHVGGSKALRLALRGIDQFVEDEEQPERVDRTGIEIVVAIFRSR